MAKGRLREQWNQTADIVSTLLNSNPFSGRKSAVHPAEVNPYAESRRPPRGVPVTAGNIDILKVFVDR